MRYAYARVSTKEQNLDRQLATLHEQKNIDFVWEEKGSGKDFKNRAIYQKLKRTLKPYDTLVVCSLDRLGRNYDEIIDEWNYYKKNNIYIQVLDMPLLNTQNNINGLDGKFIADLVLQILSYVAEKERIKIKERQAEGIKVAKEKGVIFGRPKIPIPKQAKDDMIIYQSLVKQDICATSIRENIMEKYNISRGTFFRWLKDIE